MRADYLGAAGLTTLVRCVCGARLYLPRRQWRRRTFTICDECRAVILYASLEVVAPRIAEEFIEMVIVQEEEREMLLAGVERELRRFVRAYDQQPYWLWSPATQRFVQAVRPKLELLGGPIGAMDAGPAYGLSQEAAYVHAEEDEPPDEARFDDEEVEPTPPEM